MDMFSTQIVVRGDCLERMQQTDPNSIDCILTDPPYGLSFMGKEWDHGIPGVPFWEAALDVCKPGAMMLAFGGTRTYHRLACAIEDAGWQVRDCMMWVYGSGFPKSHNIGKKLGGDWDGYGTALKPAYEPIIVAMKPLDGTFATNAEKWGVAGINVDACRVEGAERPHIEAKNEKSVNTYGDGMRGSKAIGTTTQGRWPANVIFDEEAGSMLDEQSGTLKSGATMPHHVRKHEKCLTHGKYAPTTGDNIPSSSGGASRFFYCAKASSAERNKGLEGMPLKEQTTYNEMAGTPEHSTNRQSLVANNHPTVKPIKLLEYLLKLIAPPFQGRVVLDPFVGSGSTLVAAKNIGVNAIGIELNDEYADIAERRIA